MFPRQQYRGMRCTHKRCYFAFHFRGSGYKVLNLQIDEEPLIKKRGL